MRCHFCKKAVGEVSICDDEGIEYWICFDCDEMLFGDEAERPHHSPSRTKKEVQHEPKHHHDG